MKATATRDASFDDRPIIAGFEVTKVIKDFIPIKGGGEQTFGQCLDKALYDAAKEGGIIQSMNFQVSEEQWFNFARAVSIGDIRDPAEYR